MSAVSDCKENTFSTGLEETDFQNLDSCKKICQEYEIPVSLFQILINATTQRLHLFKQSEYSCSYLISTAEKGLGQKSGSYQTPLGLHQIAEKIGDQGGEYEIFVSREKTGKVCTTADKTAYIVARILRLDGLEKGYNKGTDREGNLVDSFERYIYIHGTNHIDSLGYPTSAGCIRMSPGDVIKLFDQVPEKTIVFIYKS